MNDRSLKAVAAGARLAHLLNDLDPDGRAAEPFLPVVLETPQGELRWDLKLSETAIERLTQLLEAARPQPAPVRSLRVVGEGR